MVCRQFCTNIKTMTKQYFSTDRFWIDLLLLSVFGLFLLSLYAFTYGNPEKMTKGFNPDHMACGYDTGLINYPYIYFVTPNQQYQYRTVCVETCPKSTQNGYISNILCQPNTVVPNCKQNPSIFNLSQQVIYYDTFEYKNNICVPSTLQYYQEVQDNVQPPQNHQIIHDIYLTFWIIVLSFFSAAIVSYFLGKYINEYPATIVWIFVIGLILGLGAGGIFFMQQAIGAQRLNSSEVPPVKVFKVSSNYIQIATNKRNPVVLFSIAALFCFLFLTCCYLLYSKTERISQVIRILKITDEFIKSSNRSTGGLTQFSQIIFLITFITLTIDLYIFLYLFSCGSITKTPNQPPFQQITPDSLAPVLCAIMLIFSIWHNQFLLGCVDFVTLRSLSKWFNCIIQQDQNQYSARFEDNFRSSTQDLTFHLGSVAYASLILFVFTVPKLIIDFIIDTINDMKNQKIQKCCLTTCCCCKFIYNKWLKSVEKVMYMEIADRDVSVSTARDILVKTLNPSSNEQDPNKEEEKKKNSSSNEQENSSKKKKENASSNKQENPSDQNIVNEEDQEDQEIFERSRNLGQLFVMIARMFVIVINMCFAEATMHIVPYVYMNTYSRLIPTAICGFIGFSVSTIYLSVYGLSSEGLIYLEFKAPKTINIDKINALKPLTTFKKELKEEVNKENEELRTYRQEQSQRQEQQLQQQ